MSEYSEIQVALINARDIYEEHRSDFPDPKDRRLHKSQCDLISNHIRELAKLNHLESENKALRARVVELESVVSGYSRDNKELQRVLNRRATPWPPYILRKQAQAVEAFGQEIGVFDPEYDDQEYVEIPRREVRAYAQHLRQQADEAERAVGER